MKIFESQVRYKLSVILTRDEFHKYYEAFRSGKPVAIPEFENKNFEVLELGGYYFSGVPENSYSLDVRQAFQSTDPIERNRLLKEWDVPMRSK